MFKGEDGKFSRSLYDIYLRNSGRSENEVVSGLKQDMTITELTGVFENAAVVMSDDYVKTLYLAQHDKRKIELYKILPATVASIPEPNAEEIKAEYEKTKDNYALPEQRSVNYIEISAADFKGDVSEDEISKEYNDNIDTYTIPEKLDLKQIMLDSEDKATKALAELNAGKNFGEVSKAYNNQALTEDMKAVTRQTLPAEISDKVFALKAGEYSEVLKSKLGYHIFRLVSKTEKKIQSVEEVRNNIVQEIKKRKSEDEFYKVMTRLEDSLASSGALDSIAKEYGVEVRKTDFFSMNDKEIPSKLKNFVATAFKTMKGENSDLIDGGNGVFYALSVNDVKPSATQELEKVKAKVVESWKAEKQRNLLDEKVKKIISAENFNAALSGEKANFEKKELVVGRDGGDLPQELIGNIYKTSAGKYTAQVYEPSGKSYFVAKVIGNEAAEYKPDGEEAKQFREQLISQRQNDMFDAYLNELKRKYKVQIAHNAQPEQQQP